MANDANLAPLPMNWPQRTLFMPLHRGLINSSRSIWGRGTAKSSSIAFLIRHIVRTMPRSNWVIQGATFQQLLTRTLPGTFAFLEKIGYKRDRDYFINRFPPADFALPYECPLKPENVIFFVDRTNMCATAFTLFSQDRSSGRGPNRDGVICDESLLLDYDKFSAETLATNRGNTKYFGHLKLHHGIFHFSSMPTGQHWLIDGADYYGEAFDFYPIREKIIELNLEFLKSTDKKEQIEIWSQRTHFAKQLKYFPQNGRYYSEFDTFDNIENLGVSYIKQMYKDMPLLVFLIEMMNKRTNAIEDGFYPGLSRELHCYNGHYDYNYLDNLDHKYQDLEQLDSRQDLDVNPDLPLDLGMDFGANINWLIVGQELKDRNQFNFVKNFYRKTPHTMDDVAKDFCDYYEHHKKKVAFLWPDAEGFNRRPNQVGQTSYVDQVTRYMRKRGWSVVVGMRLKTNVLTKEHYITWARCFDEANTLFPKIRFNLINCKELIYSMEQTPAIDYGRNDIRKNKSSERSLKATREQATDAGDAADKIIYGKYHRLNAGAPSTLAGLTG